MLECTQAIGDLGEGGQYDTPILRNCLLVLIDGGLAPKPQGAPFEDGGRDGAPPKLHARPLLLRMRDDWVPLAL